jgi:hypothetical protein
MHVGQSVVVKKQTNMDNEKEITFQVGGYQSLSKVEKHFLLFEV